MRMRGAHSDEIASLRSLSTGKSATSLHMSHRVRPFCWRPGLGVDLGGAGSSLRSDSFVVIDERHHVGNPMMTSDVHNLIVHALHDRSVVRMSCGPAPKLQDVRGRTRVQLDDVSHVIGERDRIGRPVGELACEPQSIASTNCAPHLASVTSSGME